MTTQYTSRATSSEPSFLQMNNEYKHSRHSRQGSNFQTGSHAADVAQYSDYLQEDRASGYEDDHAGVDLSLMGHKNYQVQPDLHTVGTWVDPNSYNPGSDSFRAGLSCQTSRPSGLSASNNLLQRTSSTYASYPNSTDTANGVPAFVSSSSQMRSNVVGGYPTLVSNRGTNDAMLSHTNMTTIPLGGSSTARTRYIASQDVFYDDADSANRMPHNIRPGDVKPSTNNPTTLQGRRDRVLHARVPPIQVNSDRSLGVRRTAIIVNPRTQASAQLSTPSCSPMPHTNRHCHYNGPSPRSLRPSEPLTSGYATNFPSLDSASSPTPSRSSRHDQVKCPVCGKPYYDSTGVKRHMQREHASGKIKYKCRALLNGVECEQRIDRFDNMRKHWRDKHHMHFPENPGRKKFEGGERERMMNFYEEVWVRN